jgi:putative membrane protein
MMVTFEGSMRGLLQWQAANIRVYALGGVVAVAVYELVFWATGYSIAMPALPMSVVGAALGIFVSFRTNSAYDRWWEGRRLWGQLVNTSRHWASQVDGYVANEADRRRLIGRQIAYVHALRCALRGQDPWTDAAMASWIDEDQRATLAGQANLGQALLHEHMRDLVSLSDAGALDERRLQSLDSSIRSFLDVQGGCERIQKTPLPRGYGFIAEQLITIYAFLFPLAFVADLHLLAVPVNVLVCTAFILITEAGRVLEDPFSMYFNGLPLTNLSSTIEVNLRNRLGERGLPSVAGPDARGILM